MIPDPDREPESCYREGLWRGIAVMYGLVGPAKDADGMRFTLQGLEVGAWELWNLRPGERGPVARRILKELQRDEEAYYGRTYPFYLGLHASVFVALEIADRFDRRADVLEWLEEAEDAAQDAYAGRLAPGGRGLVETVVRAVDARQAYARGLEEEITGTYRFGD
jgi:hypothetical protein